VSIAWRLGPASVSLAPIQATLDANRAGPESLASFRAPRTGWLKVSCPRPMIGAVTHGEPHHRKGVVRALLAVLGGLTMLYLAYLIGLPVGRADGLLERWLGLAVEVGAVLALVCRLVFVREERRIWALVALSVSLWTLGDVYWRIALWHVEVMPVPSLADLGWLSFYAPAYAAIALLVRARVESVWATLWVDGLIGGLAVASVAAAVVFDAVLGSVGGKPALVATGLAYPVADMVLVALVLGGLQMSRRSLDRTWLWLGAGLATFAVSDSVYLVQTAGETYAPGGVLDAGWSVALVLVAFAAWRPATRVEGHEREGWSTIMMPIGFAVVALAVVMYDHFFRVNVLALILATACLGAVLTRLALTFAQNLRMLAASREEATTDVLTGLGNRRLLAHDLKRAARRIADGERMLMVLFDLNGFKQYNDSFGHPAGDSLLVRLGENLRRAMGDRGSAYRMGGDEFCILGALGDEGPDRIAMLAAAALKEEGQGFTINCAYGVVVLPDDADDADEAVRLADRRMYAQKNGGRTSASRQSRDVLLQALQERNPELGTHLDDVGRLAQATALKLGLPQELTDQVRAAGELHDVGKVAIPDAILNKPDSLDENEWAFVRRHSEIGERIVAAAPALAEVAPLVRAMHERWDGCGYPDGVAARAIPLAARIVAVCDAYDAMITERPYQRAMGAAPALQELRRCAGTQFDPDVVEAFGLVLLDDAVILSHATA
jgi:two-component system, cell cycle response regulator